MARMETNGSPVTNLKMNRPAGVRWLETPQNISGPKTTFRLQFSLPQITLNGF